MEKTVDQFIADVVKLYKLASPNASTSRALKYKLGMADIKDTVTAVDTSLALDIVLGSLQKSPKGLLRTAGVKCASVGTCPRCRGRLVEAKLAESQPIGYCEACRVAVAVL